MSGFLSDFSVSDCWFLVIKFHKFCHCHCNKQLAVIIEKYIFLVFYCQDHIQIPVFPIVDIWYLYLAILEVLG